MKYKLEDEVRVELYQQGEAWGSGLIEEQLRTGSDKHFDLVTIVYPYGKRTSFKKKQQDSYEMLQASRCSPCPSPNWGDTYDPKLIEIEELAKNAKEDLASLTNSDLVRSKELESIANSKELSDIFDLQKLNSFCELGFRVPRLLHHYRTQHEMEVSGYDVLRVSILIGRYLGFNVERYDFDDCAQQLDVDADLIVSYHMLEHVTDPLLAITKIFDAMKPGAFFHVEVPIEGPGRPRIRYCHMHAFEPRDLGMMLELAGFKVYTLSNATHEDGPYIERYLAQKTEGIKRQVQQVAEPGIHCRWELVK